MCFLERKGERDLFLLYVNIKIICYHGNTFFSILCVSNTAFGVGFGDTAILSVLHLQSHVHLTTSGTFDRDFYFFGACINMKLLTESGRGHFKFLISLIWQVLKFNVPVSMVVFNFVLFCYFMPTSQRTTLF